MKRSKSKKEEEKHIKFMKQVGLNIRSARESKGLTLEDVEAAGYPSWKHLQKVESGQPMTLKTIYKVAKAIGVQPSDLFEGVKI